MTFSNNLNNTSHKIFTKPAKFAILSVLSLSVLSLSGCQTLKNTFTKPSKAPQTQAIDSKTNAQNNSTTQDNQPTIPQTPSTPQKIIPPSFAITGKIGINYLGADGKRQAGSAFYAWGQENERFAVDLTGALGLGATTITYNGKTATIISEKTGEMTADSPDMLFTKATGWHAPISQLPFWIMGQSTPTDNRQATDEQGKLSQAVNGDWQADFDYNKSSLPSRIRITHTDGHRVVLSINGR